MNIVSLFSGIGGFDLALERMGHTTVAYSEIDPWACAVMAARFPHALPLGDLTTIDWSSFERPDIVCGGFPCQDLSLAGKRAGLAGARSGLWGQYVRAIRALGPRLVLVENVRGLLTLGMDAVLGDLADLGYDAEWKMLSAAEVGAPHRRERVWIVAELAHRDGGGREQFGLAEHAGIESSCRAEPDGRDSDGTRNWPTPRANDGRDETVASWAKRHREKAAVGINLHYPLDVAVRWPTPRTEDGESTGISATRRALGIADNLPSAVVQWRTPTTPLGGSLSEDRKIARNHCINLQDQVEMPSAVWATPVRRAPDDCDSERRRNTPALESQVLTWRTPSDPTKRGGSQSAEKRTEGGHTVNLEDQLDNPTGKLNPDWVEALMGYPVGWSDPAVPNEALIWTPFPAGRGPQFDWEPPRVTTRKDGRRKRLRCLGNAIVPACLKAVLSNE